MDSLTSKRDVVVVGASAGGIEALGALLGRLPAGLDAAVLVVVHIPAHTPSQLANVLGRVSRLPVVESVDGTPLERGKVFVARADRHLMLAEGLVRVTRGPKESRSRPSIDVLFRSASTAYGPRVIGVILSGMLDDGTAGLWAVKDKGGVALVQDPREAMYASMPESAIEHVEVDFVGPVEALAAMVTNLVETPHEPAEARPRGASERHRIEDLIAMEGNGLKAGVMELGKVSKYTCPDCHGVLVQVEEGSIVRFRCHTGHAFSMQTLLSEVNEAIDKGLWDTLRAIEERVLLLRQMEDIARRAGKAVEADRCKAQADDALKRLQPLRDLVLDPRFFGHEPGS
jgi:two-component system chemotaxis response regulator CheB